jgi:SAM-dependent methyltransferase
MQSEMAAFEEKMHPRDVSEDAAVYYTGQYWNSLDCTNRMINRRISGDEAVTWWRHFAGDTGKVFERALILNCGNGWVERELFDSGLIKHAVGIDYSAALLDEARSAAGDRPLHYVQMNVNSDALPSEPFDLVVNHSAAHHVTRLDRVFRDICRLLPEDGWFVSFDYVGPHRNQYSAHAWDQAWRLNESLPEHLRQSMDYPLLPLWIEVDPTEAVHSELIVETLHRYFNVAEFVPLGGALAYPVLTHNLQLFSPAVDPSEREHWGQFVLDRDAGYLADNPRSSLFAFFTAQPDKDVLSDHEALAAWEKAEDVREEQATANGGTYYEPSMLNEVYWALAVNEQSNLRLVRELQAIHGSVLYSRLTRILALPMVRRLLESRTLRRLRTSTAPSDEVAAGSDTIEGSRTPARPHAHSRS